ncbi:MAG TPA: hypothetical protein VGB95_03050 [Chitinophagales bacterium]
MNVKIKALLFGLLLICSVGLKAQEASGGYEYAEVQMALNKKFVYNLLVVYSDRESETIETGLGSKATTLEIHDAVLKEVGEKAKEGWIVTNTTSVTLETVEIVPVYFLRKKKQ